MSEVRPFTFTKAFSVGGTADGIEITTQASSAVWQALAANTPFPQGDIELVDASLRASAGKDFTWGSKQVSFKGNGAAYALLGFYGSGAAVSSALKINDQDEIQLDLPQPNGRRFGVFSWGYSLGAEAQGSVALAGEPGSISFSGKASGERRVAVVRLVDGTAGAWDAVQSVVESFRLPGQVKQIGDIPPGTWLYAEVDGSIAAQLGVTYGYSLDWLRSVRAGELVGDVGLKIALGIEMVLGFKTSGSCAVVVSRAPGPGTIVGVRVHKLKYKGWDFALNAGATVQAKTPALPPTFDEFLAAVVGVQRTQVVRDLRVLKEWIATDDIPDRLAGLGADYLSRKIQELGGPAITEFEAARKKVLNALDTWDALPERATSAIWSYLDRQIPLEQISGFLTRVQDATAEDLRQIVARELGETPTWKAQLLDALSQGGVFDAIVNAAALQELKIGAGRVVDALDPQGDTLAVLTRLHDWVGTELRVERIRKAATAADFDNLDDWIKAKLAALVGRPAIVDDLKKVQKTISLLEQRWDDFYAKVQAALTRKYQFDLAATYTRASTGTALVDLEFDLAQQDARSAFGNAVQGRLGEILAKATAGVTVRSGALSHGVERHTHVGISLPWYNEDADHINSSLASATAAIAADGERVLVYKVESTDTVTALVRGRLARESRLAIALSMSAGKGRVDAANGRVTYSFRSASARMRPLELRERVAPLLETYFGHLFASTGTVTREPSSSWILDLDHRIPQIGSNLLGNVLLSFDLALPERALTSWLKAPLDPKDNAYAEMSFRIQDTLKSYLPMVYFADLDRYKNTQGASIGALLTYSSARPIAEPNHEWYWKYLEPSALESVVRESITSAHLGAKLDHIRDLLQGSSQPSWAKDFGREKTGPFLAAALSDQGRRLLTALFMLEATIVRSARQAALKLAQFRESNHADADAATSALAEFAGELTDAFNAKLVSAYAKDGLRPLGPLVLAQAGRAFDATGETDRDAASLRVVVVKGGGSFPPASLGDYEPAPDLIVTEDRLISVP